MTNPKAPPEAASPKGVEAAKPAATPDPKTGELPDNTLDKVAGGFLDLGPVVNKAIANAKNVAGQLATQAIKNQGHH